jgi:hypothetical protein
MKSDTVGYKLIRVLTDKRDDSLGIGFEFHRPDSPFLLCADFPLHCKDVKTEGVDKVGLIARQACLIPKHATMAEVGAILVKLGEFFQSPQEDVLRWDCDILTGHELDCSPMPMQVRRRPA